jgi:hypothetical protein
MGNKMFKVHSYVRQNDSECRKWKVYRGFTLHGFLPHVIINVFSTAPENQKMCL